MSNIDPTGLVTHPRVQLRRFTDIERGALARLEGSIAHQTDADESGVFGSYRHASANGVAEVHRQPDLSWKNPTEASTARWK